MAWSGCLCPATGRPGIIGALHWSAIKLLVGVFLYEVGQFAVVCSQHCHRLWPVKIGLAPSQIGIIPLEVIPFVAFCGEVNGFSRAAVCMPPQEEINPVGSVGNNIFNRCVVLTFYQSGYRIS